MNELSEEFLATIRIEGTGAAVRFAEEAYKKQPTVRNKSIWNAQEEAFTETQQRHAQREKNKKDKRLAQELTRELAQGKKQTRSQTAKSSGSTQGM